jgi:hypothetical protein
MKIKWEKEVGKVPNLKKLGRFANNFFLIFFGGLESLKAIFKKFVITSRLSSNHVWRQ